MLVLTRRVNQVIMVGENIEFRIIWLSGDEVCVGIEAPKEVHIVRKELVGKPIREKHANQPSLPDNKSPHPKPTIQFRRRRPAHD